MLCIFWKDRITIEEVKARTKQHSIASTLSEEDYDGLVTCCEWITSAFHSKHYTGRFKASRGDRVGQEQTGEA